MLAPAGTPDSVVAKINADMQLASQDEEVKAQMVKTGASIGITSSEAFGQFLTQGEARLQNLVNQGRQDRAELSPVAFMASHASTRKLARESHHDSLFSQYRGPSCASAVLLRSSQGQRPQSRKAMLTVRVAFRFRIYA